MSGPLSLKNDKANTNSNKWSSTLPSLKHARKQSLQLQYQRQAKNREENSMKINLLTKRNSFKDNRPDVVTPIRIPRAAKSQTEIKLHTKSTKMETPVPINKKNVSEALCKRSLKGTTSSIIKSVSKNSARKSEIPHSGVPITEKLRKSIALLQKELAIRSQTEIKLLTKSTKMETPVQINKKNDSVALWKRSLKGTSSIIKSESKNSAKKSEIPHAGVPITEKLRKALALLRKELNL